MTVFINSTEIYCGTFLDFNLGYFGEIKVKVVFVYPAGEFCGFIIRNFKIIPEKR